MFSSIPYKVSGSFSGKSYNTTANVSIIIPENKQRKKVKVIARAGNGSAGIYISPSEEASPNATSPFKLDAGQSIELETTSALYFKSTANNQKFSVIEML